MNKKNFINMKLVISFFALFVSFITVIRVLEYRYNYSLLPLKISKFKINSNQNESCIAKENSITSFLKKNKLNTLIVILDGFPTNESIHKYYKNGSNLHRYMVGKDYFYHSGKTIINSSSYSLAYLLSGLNPSSKCAYPFNIDVDNLNFLLASVSFSDQNSICREGMPFKFDSTLRNLRRFIKKKYMLLIKKDLTYTSYHANFKNECDLSNKKFVNKAISTVRGKAGEISNTTYIIHEMQAKRFNKEKYPSLDKSYLEHINLLRNELLEKGYLDLIIVMSDHGLRKSNLADLSNKNETKLNKFIEEDHFGYFMYFIENKKNKQIISNIENYLPNTVNLENRYYLDSFNNPRNLVEELNFR